MSVHTSAICARRASPSVVHSNLTALKCTVCSINTLIRSVEQRCMCAKNVVTQPVNRKFIIYTSKKTIPIPRPYLNSTISVILSSQTRNLRIICLANCQCRFIIKSHTNKYTESEFLFLRFEFFFLSSKSFLFFLFVDFLLLLFKQI